MPPIILGSQSPRRKEILSFFNISFKQHSSNFDEEAVPFTGDPSEYVTILSKSKASILSSIYPEAVILTADTVVYQDNKIYGKPKDTIDAFRILSELSGRWHSVYTGLTVTQGKMQYHKVEETAVLFNDLTIDQIESYIERCHLLDKAGSYGIQTGAGLPVKKIHGCYYNVMGLPINALRELFFEVGIDLWQYIKE